MVTLAFRRSLPSDDWVTRWSARRHASRDSSCAWAETSPINDVCHVEIIVLHPCGGRRCALCGGSGDRRRMHQLSYSVTGMPTRDKVFFSVDREYDAAQVDGSPLWVFYTADMSADECAYVSDFLRCQLGVPFNRIGLYANFVHMPCTSCPLVTFGCRFDEEFRYADTRVARDHNWFCSELATAAIQWTGICHGLDPCHVSPNLLLAAVHDSDRFALAGDEVKVPERQKPVRVVAPAAQVAQAAQARPERFVANPFAAAHAKAVTTRSKRSVWV